MCHLAPIAIGTRLIGSWAYARTLAGEVFVVHQWIRPGAAVIGTPGENRRRGAAPDFPAVRFRFSIPRPDLRQVRRQQVIEALSLRGKHRDQRVVGCLCDGGIDGRAATGRSYAGVAVIAADDGIHGIEYRDVHDRNGAARATGTDLFAEDAVFTRLYRCVVEAAGIDRDLVPVAQRVGRAR